MADSNLRVARCVVHHALVRRRSSVTGRGGSDYDRPETIEETAALVTELGGTSIAIQVDHLEPRQVEILAERIRTDHGHIDILVNDI